MGEIPKKSRFSAELENSLKTLFAGGVAGAISRTAVAPLERLKILFQVNNFRVHLFPISHNLKTQLRSPGHSLEYQTIAQSLIKIVKEEGLRGYYKGVNTIQG
jgi:solute carrier family 25 phosphate transporter 23/24/25/41